MIVYCCTDLIFATKIRSTAETLGFASRPARDVEALQRRLDQIDDGKLNEPVSGVFIDLEVPEALAMLRQTKAHDPSLPVVAFGSHVATEVLENARRDGADFVMPRSTFTSTLPDILQRFGR